MCPIRNGSGLTGFLSAVNTVERKEEHYAFVEICC